MSKKRTVISISLNENEMGQFEVIKKYRNKEFPFVKLTNSDVLKSILAEYYVNNSYKFY